MNGVLPHEIYNLIVGNLPYSEYAEIRLVSCDWNNIVEQSTYGEIIRCIRILQQAPNYKIEMNVDSIDFCDGSIHSNDHNYRYHNGKLEELTGLWMTINRYGQIDDIPDTDPLQIINNTYGTYKLYVHNSKIHITHDDIALPLIDCRGYYPYLIRADTEVHLVDQGLFIYRNSKWNVIHVSTDMVHYRLMYQYHQISTRIYILDTYGHKIGVIKLSCYHFGMGPNYLVIYKNNHLSIWHL